jgi:hypothetical protein
VQAWLAQASYTSWHCEAAPHAARSPSPHGTNRICSNELASTHGAGEYPVDAAAVKEIYDGTGQVHAYAVYRHVSAGPGGANWFWFEGAASDVFAFGLGDSGAPHDSCANCHGAAGRDADHRGSRLRLHPSPLTEALTMGSSPDLIVKQSVWQGRARLSPCAARRCFR